MKYPYPRIGSNPTYVFAHPGENMIQDAIDASEDGDIVVIYGDHTLTESVHIDSDIALSGVGSHIHLDLEDEIAFDVKGAALISNITASGVAGTVFEVGSNCSIFGCCFNLDRRDGD